MGRRHRLRRLAALGWILVVLGAAPVLAGPEREAVGGATVDESQGAVSIEAGSSVSVGAGSSSATAGTTGDGEGDGAAFVAVNENICRAPLSAGGEPCPAEPPTPGAPVDPQVLAAQARGQLTLPAPEIRLNPAPPRDQLVNLTTWMWLDPASWGTRTSQVAVPGVAVTASARPERVIWDMGNGDRVVCHGPGVAYDSARPEGAQRSDCSYTYRRSSAGRPQQRYVVTATVEWSASWAVVGVPGGGSLPGLRRSTSVPVRVAEVQAVNVVSNPG